MKKSAQVKNRKEEKIFSTGIKSAASCSIFFAEFSAVSDSEINQNNFSKIDQLENANESELDQ